MPGGILAARLLGNTASLDVGNDGAVGYYMLLTTYVTQGYVTCLYLHLEEAVVLR